MQSLTIKKKKKHFGIYGGLGLMSCFTRVSLHDRAVQGGKAGIIGSI